MPAPSLKACGATKTVTGPAVFRLKEHTRRLLDSAKIYRIEVPYTLEQLIAAQVELVRVNHLRSCYIRPIVLRGYGQHRRVALRQSHRGLPGLLGMGQVPRRRGPGQGVDVAVSSWTRIAPNTLPALAKAAGNYMNSQLVRMQAHLDGYAEGIALDESGKISEGSGENIFVVRDGKIHTPPMASSVLPGITRDSVITLARELDIPVIETQIPREMLYIADEVFFTGTAAEVTPIRSVDKISIGSGRRGPITERLQKAFFDVVTGHAPDKHGWLTPVPAAEPVPA